MASIAQGGWASALWRLWEWFLSWLPFSVRGGEEPGSDAQQPSEVELRIEELARQARSMRAGVDGNTNPIRISDAVTATPQGDLQWVQLVMAGGGMLGIAHVGFVRALEEAGVRFLGLGGTSAGAINAALIAAVRKDPTDVSWQATRDLFLECPFDSFEDGSWYFRFMRQLMLPSGSPLVPSDPNSPLVSLAWVASLTPIQLAQAAVKLAVAGAVSLLNIPQIIRAVLRMGLHRGSAFRDWLLGVLWEKGGVVTLEQLAAKWQLPAGTRILHRATNADVAPLLSQQLLSYGGFKGGPGSREDLPLKLVAAELSTQTMVVFPQDADLFYPDAASAPVADFVRTSMSVPLFFEPFTLPGPDLPPALGPDGRPSAYRDPQTGMLKLRLQKPPAKGSSQKLKGARQKSEVWEKRNGYAGEVPDKAMFVDGGTLSNFPIGLFHTEEGVPLMPTLGVQFGEDRSHPQPVGTLVDLVACMNSTSRHLMDRDFLAHNPDYANLMATIDTTGFGLLDFSMPKDTRDRLFCTGMETAVKFLQSWQEKRVKTVREAGQEVKMELEPKWEYYKKLRGEMEGPRKQRRAGPAPAPAAAHAGLVVPPAAKAEPATPDAQAGLAPAAAAAPTAHGMARGGRTNGKEAPSGGRLVA